MYPSLLCARLPGDKKSDIPKLILGHQACMTSQKSLPA
jgi:hypothetical protein